jgi:hypothetical protein
LFFNRNKNLVTNDRSKHSEFMTIPFSWRNISWSLLMSGGCLLSPLVLPQTTQAQRIVDANPALNSENISPDTSISGLFEGSEQAEVDTRSVKIFVNNADVTSRSTINPRFFSYRPDKPLPPGPNQVRVEYKNTKGKSQMAVWSFQVRSPQSALKITSVSHNAVSEALGPGATFLATINGTPKAKGSILLILDKKTVRELPAQEVSPGVYVATLNVAAGDLVNEGIVVGRLQGQNQKVYASAAQAAVFSTSAQTKPMPPKGEGTPPSNANTATTNALRPVFISHQNGDTINSDGFTLEGQTQPNAKVTIKVTSSVPVLGGLVNLGGNTLVDREIIADANGRFRVQVPAAASGTKYTVRAIASLDNQASSPTQITLTQQ